MKSISIIAVFVAALLLNACGSGNGNSDQAPPGPPAVSVSADVKQLMFAWDEVAGATHYRLLENVDGHSGFTQSGDDIPAGTLSVTRDIAVHLHDFANALYMLQACNSSGCAGSAEVSATNLGLDAIGYFKASNPETGLENYNVEFPNGDRFGAAVALSADGSTLAVGAPNEDGGVAGINGEQNDNSAWDAGAVYIFRLIGAEWLQQAYIKASNAGGGDRTDYYGRGDQFGYAVSLSSDGNTLAVGARYEASSATGVNGDYVDNSAPNSGAAYVFRFDGTDWSQQAYVKASNTEGSFSPNEADGFGHAIALNADGNTLAVGAPGEDSNATGIDGDQADNSAERAGAAYVFRFDGADWSQQAYVKASTTEVGFGDAVALSADGNTMAVEGYIFQFDGTDWHEQACVLTLEFSRCAHGSNDLSADGNTMLLGSSIFRSARIFRFDGTEWFEQLNIEFSNPGGNVRTGNFALSGDGNMAAIGVHTFDDSWNAYIEAVHIFRFDGEEWPQRGDPIIQNPASPSADCDWSPYMKDWFGYPASLNSDGSTIAVGATGEDSGSPGVGGDRSDGSECESGAVYLY